MTTEILSLDQMEKAGEILTRGGLVVFPTETVYGLGANALDPEASSRIFSAKGRPGDNPLIIHLFNTSQLAGITEELSPDALKLIEAFWPGPLTLILPKLPGIPGIVSAGLPTVGVRMPKSPEALGFLRACGVPVAAPSANLSGSPSSTTFEMAKFNMMGRVDAIIQGPDCELGLESTIIGFPDDVPKIYRSGSISAESVASLLGANAESLVLNASESDRPMAPGTRHPHYKPKARVRLFTDLSEIKDATSNDWILGMNLDKVVHPCTLKSFSSVEDYARKLFSFFFEADKNAVRVVWCWFPPDGGLGKALRDRLERAAR